MTADFANGGGGGLNRRVTRGAVWMIALRFADRIVAYSVRSFLCDSWYRPTSAWSLLQ